jgi:hypothetical protein
MVKVALCFYGQPRYVNNRNIPHSYSKQFNKDEYQLDTFGHCWYEKNVVYSSSSWTQQHADYKPNDDTIKNLYDYYSFNKLVVERPKLFILPDQLKEHYKNICSKHVINFTEMRENNTLSHLFSIQNVSRIAPDSFDFYVLCRYDTVIDNIPDLTSVDPDKLYLCNMGLFPDPIIVFGKKFLNWSRNQYDNAVTKTYNMDGFMPENFKMHSFLEHHSWNDVIHCNMWATIMRDE